MRIDPAGFPFIGRRARRGGAGRHRRSAGRSASRSSSSPRFFLFFFRDPERLVNAAADAVLSPADGRVLVAGPAVPAAAPPGEWLQISIFLSPMDVHVNRVPASGRVTRVSFQRGRFLPAYHHDAAATNERSEIWIDHNGRHDRRAADRGRARAPRGLPAGGRRRGAAPATATG